MEETEMIALWRSYGKKLDESLLLNRRNTEDLTKLKVKSLLATMKPLKVFTIVAGILWVSLVDVLLIHLLPFASLFFLVSAGIQVLLTQIAIGIYLYQLILINRVNITEPVLATQATLARLRSTTLMVARILFLQLPVWTTFYLNKSMAENGNGALYLLQAVVTLSFLYIAIWLFRNISYDNRNKKWFKLIFNGREWNPVIQSMELLQQIDEFKEEK